MALKIGAAFALALLSASPGGARPGHHRASAAVVPRVEIPAALVRGVINPEVTQANIHRTICVSGWTDTIRPPTSYTNALKREQMRDFRLSGDPSDYEEDHLISLEVGGSPTSRDNLWPQAWTGPRNARQKDRLENLIKKLVCSGRIKLSQGRRELSKDWVASYRNRIGPMP